MKNKILNHKAKLLVLCLSASLAACGGDTTNPESQHKSVSISATSTIPTSLGVSGGGHALKVDNHTGKNLTLSSFYLSGAKENHDLRINLAGCKTLANDSSCVPIFSPDEADGSTVLKLDFVDDNGEHYSAAQLVEYSSQVVESNGFYVSSANLDSMTATAAYSVAIPFVADDDYSSISIDSSIKTLSQSIRACSLVQRALGFLSPPIPKAAISALVSLLLRLSRLLSYSISLKTRSVISP